jgi:hypothetical protein
MKMKIKNILFSGFFAALLIILMVTGCKKPGDLTINPVQYDTAFTFSPSHGFPGNTVKISGSDLTGVTGVAFGNIAGDISSQSASEINVIVPVGAQTAKIKLVKAELVITSLINFEVDATPIPTVIEFSPGVAGSGDIIDITGNLLDEVDSVFIGTLKADIIGTPTASAMQIETPVGLKTGKIRLFYTYLTSYGMLKPAESASAMDLTLALPVITSIYPVISTLNISDSVAIIGTMLSEVTKVEFGTINATPFVQHGDTMITCKVPAGATTGNIKLTHLDGFTESGTFQVNLPVITLFLPDKGAEGAPAATRAFSVDGTKLDLVTSVLVGATTATIQTKTATKLIFTVPGNIAGFISLITANGTVKTAIPFFFTGNMWLADYDNMYTPVRLFNEPMYVGVGGSESFQEASSIVKSIGNNADSYGNFRRFSTTLNATGSPRIYIRGDQGGAQNPAPDRYLLYTPNSQGVNFEFDISWDVIPDTLVDANGEVLLKVMFFNADQTAGGGYGFYTDLIKVKYDGPGVWKHVAINTYLTRVGGSDFMYNKLVPAVTSKKFSPNNCRIITVMFLGAYGGTVASPAPGSGQQMVVNYDNVKFVIN